MNIALASNNELDAYTQRQDRKSKFLLYREMEATSRKDWLVQGLLGAGDGSAWYGIPGCGKSAIAQDLAMHIAGGREWHGRTVKRGAVLYVALERIYDDHDHVLTRLGFHLFAGIDQRSHGLGSPQIEYATD